MKTVFLDLDGTLTDAGAGIVRSVRHALERLGLPTPAPEELTWVVGPPLVESFAKLGAPDPDEALRLYRARYTEVGLYENRVYQGIPEALEAMTSRYRLCVATAKPHVYAQRITTHFGLAPYFAAEFGPELDGTHNNKAILLAHALDSLGLDASGCVMVGDRHHDIDAARTVGMPSIGVAWGYGAPNELAGATARCATPETLAATVGAILGD